MVIYLRLKNDTNIVECEILEKDISVNIYLENFVHWYEELSNHEKISTLIKFDTLTELRGFYHEVLWEAYKKDYIKMNNKIKEIFKECTEKYDLVYIED